MLLLVCGQKTTVFKAKNVSPSQYNNNNNYKDNYYYDHYEHLDSYC